MPVALTPTTPFVVTSDMIRMFMRDYAIGHLPGSQGNVILADVQFAPDELTFAINMTVSAFNVITPFSGYTAENFPNEYLMLIGCARFLLMSESFHQLRNQVNVQDGDIAPSGIYEKAQTYHAMSQALQQEWNTLSRSLKNQFNMEGAYGHIGSGYTYIGRGRYGS